MAAALSLVLCLSGLRAQEKGYWRANGSTAEAITGDIAISDTKITINFAAFTIAQIRRLNASEVMAVFNADAGAGTGNLYRLDIPATRRFLHHNTLCGGEDTQWMATFVEGHNLRMALFSGATMPSLTMESVNNSTDLCGTFSYAR